MKIKIIKHVYTKLQELNSLNAILAEQITECLGFNTFCFEGLMAK